MPPRRVRPPGSRRKCQYKGCKNVEKDCVGKRFFCFPNPNKRPELFKQWIINTENIEILDSVAKNYLHKRVCEDHFKDACFRDARRLKLWHYAVPEPRECTSSESCDTPPPPDSPRSHQQPSTPDRPRPSTSASTDPPILDSPSGNRWNRSSTSTTLKQTSLMDSPSGNRWKVDKPRTVSSPGKPSHKRFIRKSSKNENRSTKKTKSPLKVKRFHNVISKSVQVGISRLRYVKTKLDVDRKRAAINRLKKKTHPLKLSNKFLNMIERHNKKCKFTDSERNMVLSLYYKSPAAYEFLRKQLLLKSLPSRVTILRWLKNLTVRPGINSDFFKLLQNKVKDMPDSDKDVVVLMDEINLKKGLEYDPKNDCVVGFQNHGDVSLPQLANHALLVMIRGLKARWKLPVAHFFSCGVTTSYALVKIVKRIIQELQKIGLRVRVLVCDQGSPNRRAMNLLGVTRSKPYFLVDKRKVYLVYDVPHLIKNIRNNMMRAQCIIFDGGVAKWSHIVDLFHCDQKKEGDMVKDRLNTKLTEKHLNPVGRERMNVRLATQVFSHTVQAALLTAAQMPEFGAAAEETAVFVGRLNDCFDALNIKTLYGRSALHSALSTKNKKPEEFLKETIIWCDKLKVLTKNDKMKTVPCFWGLKMALVSVLKLWEDLKDEGTSFLLTARLN